MAPNGHFNVGVASIQPGYWISGCHNTHTINTVLGLLYCQEVVEPCLRVTGHRVDDFGRSDRVGSCLGSVWQTRCLSRFCSFCTRFIVAFGETIRHLGICEIPCTLYFHVVSFTISDSILSKFHNYVGNFRVILYMYVCCIDQRLLAESIH